MSCRRPPSTCKDLIMAIIRRNPDNDFLPGTTTSVEVLAFVRKAVPGQGDLGLMRSDGDTIVRGNTDDDPAPNLEIQLSSVNLGLLTSDLIGVF
jgi:hypothetical protein